MNIFQSSLKYFGLGKLQSPLLNSFNILNNVKNQFQPNISSNLGINRGVARIHGRIEGYTRRWSFPITENGGAQKQPNVNSYGKYFIIYTN